MVGTRNTAKNLTKKQRTNVLKTVKKRSASKSLTTKQRKTQKNKKKLGKKASKEHKNGEHCCDACGKSFVKASNLKSHIEVKHKGLAWICPFCRKNQSSKFSHVRHMKTCQDAKTSETDPDSNSFYLKSKIQYTAKSAASLIDRLQKLNEAQFKVIAELKSCLLLSLKRNIALKTILHANHKDEDTLLEWLQKLSTNEPIENENVAEEEKEDDDDVDDDEENGDEECEEEQESNEEETDVEVGEDLYVYNEENVAGPSSK